MKTVARETVLLPAAVTAAVPVSVLGAAGTAQTGVVCAAERDGIEVYQAPRPDARVVKTLHRGLLYGCGSTSHPEFARVSRLHDGHLVGYAYWNVMRDRRAG